MLEQIKNLRLVIMDRPYDTWDNVKTQSLFLKTVSLKLKNYLGEYPYGVLPVDTCDFIGTHHLICQEFNGELMPLMGYKSTTLSRSKQHNITFPALAILQSSGALQHAQEVQKILNRCETQDTEISYDGSWTIAQSVRQNREFADELKKTMMAIQVHYHIRDKIPEMVGFGMIRFKTNRYFEEMGYKQFTCEGTPLPPVKMSTLQNEPAILLHLQKFSDTALALADQYSYLWDNRLIIANPDFSSAHEWRKAA